MDETDEVVHEDADTVVTFLRNTLQSFGVEAFSLTADGPTVMDKVRRVLAEGGDVLGLRCLAYIFHKGVGHSLDTKGVKEPCSCFECSN